MDFTLSDEQQLIRQTARAFCDAEITPHAAEWDRTETIDRNVVAKLAELGFLAAALPEEHGGMGLDMVSYALVVEEIAKPKEVETREPVKQPAAEISPEEKIARREVIRPEERDVPP